MPAVAYDAQGELVDAEHLDAALWEHLKIASPPGAFRMTCCDAPAVLKTSPNGLPFFAHLAGECGNASETAWHREGKALIVAKLAALGIACEQEASGGTPAAPWRADTLFRVGQRTVAIELQRSYQHLRDYLARQARYRADGVECYWLTRRDHFITVAKATSKKRLMEDFGGKIPAGGFMPQLRDLPIAILETGEAPRVDGAAFFTAPLEVWLRAVADGRYGYHEAGKWLIQ